MDVNSVARLGSKAQIGLLFDTSCSFFLVEVYTASTSNDYEDEFARSSSILSNL